MSTTKSYTTNETITENTESGNTFNIQSESTQGTSKKNCFEFQILEDNFTIVKVEQKGNCLAFGKYIIMEEVDEEEIKKKIESRSWDIIVGVIQAVLYDHEIENKK